MPLYYYKCNPCQAGKAVLRSAKAAMSSPPVCRICGKPMARDPQGATTRAVEVRDNGNMGRAVEQISDVERMVWERAHQDESKFRKP